MTAMDMVQGRLTGFGSPTGCSAFFAEEPVDGNPQPVVSALFAKTTTKLTGARFLARPCSAPCCTAL